MATAVENACRMLGIDLAAAVRMASLNPARALGIHDRVGAIQPGLRADLALMTPDGKIAQTWVSGRPAS
jgi:N-acetylglucosamine-6-phosphate deacetylase